MQRSMSIFLSDYRIRLTEYLNNLERHFTFKLIVAAIMECFVKFFFSIPLSVLEFKDVVLVHELHF